jgi:hypothetical protein
MFHEVPKVPKTEENSIAKIRAERALAARMR